MQHFTPKIDGCIVARTPKTSQSATNDVPPQPIDTDKLSAALTAALKILQPGSNAQVKVTKRGAK